MGKKTRLPKSPLAGTSWLLEPEDELALSLSMAEKEFQADPTNSLSAFQALASIVAFFWQTQTSPASETIEFPWWAAEVLAEGYMRYFDSASTSTSVSLGEAYNLEGHGQGKEPRIQKYVRDLRDFRIALSIALLEEGQIKIEAALQQLAEETELSPGHIRRIWQTRKERARQSLRNFRTRISS